MKAKININRNKGRIKARKRDLERAGRLLAHCAKVPRGGGRIFCRRIYDLTATLREPYHFARLNGGFREDIDWWDKFAAVFNGKAGMLGRLSPSHDL